MHIAGMIVGLLTGAVAMALFDRKRYWQATAIVIVGGATGLILITPQ
jgi:hypothetical protein